MVRSIVTAVLLLVSSRLVAVIQPICDVDCTPDPSPTSEYYAVVDARPLPQNPRSSNGQFPVMGSQSYSYSIPITHLPGRNGLDLDLTLQYNSRIWTINRANNTITLNADRDWPSYGFRLDFGYLEFSAGTNNWILTEGDGTKHRLVNSGPGSWVTDDSSFIIYTSANRTITYKNGKFVQYEPFASQSSAQPPALFRPKKIKDTNGNFISITYVPAKDQAIQQIVDTLGRIISFQYDGEGKLISIKQGTKTYATFTWGVTPLSYSFTGLTPQGALVSGTPAKVITDCIYPHGIQYHFDYVDWAIVQKITLKSSSGLARSWERYDFPPTSAGAINDAPTYTHQFVSADGVNETASLHEVTKANNLVSSYQVTDVSGTATKTTFFTATGDWRAGLVQSVDIFNGSTPTRTITNEWTSDVNRSNARVFRVTTTLRDVTPNLASRVEYRYQGETTIGQAANSSTGNAEQRDEYDFDGSLKRRTLSTFVPATSNHILNLISTLEIIDGGTRLSLTDFSYDGFPSTDSPTGASNHDDALTGPRGNLTNIKRYTNAAAQTGAISRDFKYDWFGNVRIAQLDCCSQKKITFTSNTQFAYPEQIVRGPDVGPQLTTSATYDNGTGLTLTSTDENGQQIRFGFDPLSDRLTSIDQPSALTNPTRLITTIQYDDASAQPGVSRTNNANSSVLTSISDGLDRLRFQKLLNASTLVSTVETQYDDANRIIRTSNPFGPGETPVFTTTTSDALGRTKLVTPPSQGSQSFDYVGRQVTITDPAGKKRRNFTDALGRLVEVDEPGPFPSTAGSGNVTITGSVQSTGGISGAGRVTISGTERSKRVCEIIEPGFPRQCWTEYDFGAVTVTVNGFSKSATYGNNSTSSTIASALANVFNADVNSPVTASSSAGVLNLTAKARGAGTNYPLSASSRSDDIDYFSGTSFPVTPSGSALTGGADGVVDTGTVSITVNGFTKTSNYGSGSTALTITSNLASQFNGDASSPVTASTSNGVVSLTSKQKGASTNYSLSTAKTWDTAHFANPSFTPSSGSLLTGGVDAGVSIDSPVTTVYSYDAMDKLTRVVQSDQAPGSQNPSSQTRTYWYDGLGRLTWFSNPETGNVWFTYTDFSDVLTRSDARGVITNYGYDGLNRLKTVTYDVSGAAGVPATPGITFNYGTSAAANNNGRLLQMVDGTGSETYTYNPAGAVAQVSKVINGTTYNTGYAYNALGQLQTLTYPGSRTVTQNYDLIGRLAQISSAGTNYLTINSADYNAAGQVKLLTLGNGVQGTFTYNDHLQLGSLKYNKGATELLNLAYKYAAANGGNNGQIQGIDDNIGGTNNPAKSISFTYDEWMRLSAAQTQDLTAPQTWKLTWSYDRYGNRLSQNLVGGTLPVTSPQLTISTATNRITTAGYVYDANGNLTNDSLHTYTYDAENRLVAVDGTAAAYSYDGAGLRVKRATGNTVRTIIFSGTTPIAEYLNGALRREYIYAGSQLLTRFDTVSGVTTATYELHDQLSNRVDTDTSGTVVRTVGTLPFGDVWYETGTPEKWKFTSYERDTESDLDYATARFSSWRLGRFMSPDPLHGTKSIPQSQNRYTYVHNDPINLVDPLGLDVECVTTCVRDSDGNVLSCQVSCTVIVTDRADDFDDAVCHSNGGSGGGHGGGGRGGRGDREKIDRAKNIAKDLLNLSDCFNFLQNLLKTLGVPEAGQDPDNIGRLLNDQVHDRALTNVVPSPRPDPDKPRFRTTAHVPVVGKTTTIHVDAPGAWDLPQTLLHEVLHTTYYGFNDIDLSRAAGRPMLSNLNREQQIERGSRNFSDEMNRHCNPSRLPKK